MWEPSEFSNQLHGVRHRVEIHAPTSVRRGAAESAECYSRSVRTFALLVCFGVCGCSSDKFVGGDAAPEGSTGCGHELCDNFDMPNEVAGGAPWTARNGPLSITQSGFSKPNALEAPATLGTYVMWALPKIGGIACQAMVWLDPAMDRGRTIAFFEVDIAADGGIATVSFTVTVDSGHVTGFMGAKGAVGGVNTWGQSGTAPPTGMWMPFHFETTITGSQIALQATVASSALSGSPMVPGKILSARMGFGAANLDPMHMDIVRWDDIACDSK